MEVQLQLHCSRRRNEIQAQINEYNELLDYIQKVETESTSDQSDQNKGDKKGANSKTKDKAQIKLQIEQEVKKLAMFNPNKAVVAGMKIHENKLKYSAKTGEFLFD